MEGERGKGDWGMIWKGEARKGPARPLSAFLFVLLEVFLKQQTTQREEEGGRETNAPAVFVAPQLAASNLLTQERRGGRGEEGREEREGK